jgi:hypothetical protein
MNRRRPSPVHSQVPPKKPVEQHHQTTSYSISPERKRWVQENYDRLGYRNPSHLVDDLIRELMSESKDNHATGREKREK